MKAFQFVVMAALGLVSIGAQADSFDLYGTQVKVLNCSSNSKDFRRCPVGGQVVGASLIDQQSSTKCVRGKNWGIDSSAIWVNDGCRAIFRVTYVTHGNGGGHGGDLQSDKLRCGSKNYNYNECRADFPIVQAQVIEQKSSSDCDRGSTWGIVNGKIWVNHGCEAIFRVYGYDN